MEGFTKYLEERGMVKGNITTRVNHIKKWLDWLGIEVEDSSYKNLMDYIGYLQEAGKSVSQINKRLQAISAYYDYRELPNIALRTRVKGGIEKASSKPFSAEELDLIYELYESKSRNYFKNSDQLILGLIIYQGIELGDLMNVELKDVDLKNGKIYIPERNRRLSRSLKLESKQILPIYNYIEHYRITEGEKLLSPQGNDYHQLHWQFKKLSKSVKQQVRKNLNLELDKLSQLRQSRIIIWVKEEGLRQAQYKAGFRRVLSAERYRKADLSDLKKQLRVHHPYQ